jgi:hypothetical protein
LLGGFSIGWLWLLIINIRRKNNDDAIKLILSMGLLLICFIFVIITTNQKANGIPYLFVSIGIMQIVIINSIDNNIGYYNRYMKYNKLINTIIILTVIVGAFIFNIKINATRQVNDMHYKKSIKKVKGAVLPDQLSFMVWHLSYLYIFTLDDLNETIKYFKINSGNFLLIGDASILYALTNRPSVNPALYYQIRVCFPGPEDKGYSEYLRKLEENLKKYKVKYIVLEGKGAKWKNINMEFFRGILNNKLSNENDPIKIGNYKIYKLIQ